MNNDWKKTEAWVAYFDILGFKYMINQKHDSLSIELLKSAIDSAISHIEKEIVKFGLEYTSYSDTFIIYTKTPTHKEYPGIIRAAKNFIYKCTYERLPIRGAISFGELILGHNGRILMGNAFLEGYEYAEDQNWIGLLLTPSATQQAKLVGLEPIRHGFTNNGIPLRKFPIHDEDVYAYYFINGSSSSECPLLPIFREMRALAPEAEEVKFFNTIRFIEKNYHRY